MNSHSRVPRSLRLFDPVREIIRRKHYSARAVRAYLYWGPVVGMFPVNRDAQRVIEFDCLMSK